MATDIQLPRVNVSNVTHLAAELATTGCAPNVAAIVATKLCQLGRSYKRISERLCGGEEEWGRWSDAVEKAQKRADRRRENIAKYCADLLTQVTDGRGHIEGSGLMLSAHILPRGNGRPDTVTVLL